MIQPSLKKLSLVITLLFFVGCSETGTTVEEGSIETEQSAGETEQQKEEMRKGGLANNEIEILLEEEHSETITQEAVQALANSAKELESGTVNPSELEEPVAEPTEDGEPSEFSDDPLMTEEELVEGSQGTEDEGLVEIDLGMLSIHSSTETILEELLTGHNRPNRSGRENIIFVGHGSRSKTYFISQALKILDLEGEGLPTTGGRTAHGLFGQAVFDGKRDKFNFWYVDLASHSIDRSRSLNNYCSLEKDFDGIEDDILEQVSLRHKTFIHMLSNTNCRSQANWFRIRLDQRLNDLLRAAFDWGRISGNLLRVLSGNMTFYETLVDGVNWENLFSRVVDLNTHPRIFLNLYDKNRSQPRPLFIDVAVHELGHAFVKFMDEYAENTVSDILHLGALKSFLDFNINLTGFFPSWTRMIYNIPSVTINPFRQLLNWSGLFATNCAATYSSAQSRWGDLAGQGVGDLRIQTQVGCLYYANHFYRSSRDSKMKTSTNPFNLFQERYLKAHFLDQRSS
ncbi:MAG: hypothetical protein HY539_04895 [Deltaproteobacteria bacterium]|nr:hypothetical protein [Deltaproteobacteria bacterium]